MPLIKKRRPKIPKPPSLLRLEQSYATEINLLLEPLHELIRAHLFPVLPSIVNEVSIRTDDDETDIIDNSLEKIRRQYGRIVSKDDAKRVATRTARKVNKKQSEYHTETMRRVLGVNPVQAEPWLQPEVNSFVNENASLITTLPEESLSDIEQMVYRDSKRGLSPQAMQSNILDQFDVSAGRAKVIARDQVSKFNGRLTELRQVNAGITKYIWTTSKDGRVRSSHQDLDGNVYEWSDPPVTVTSGKRKGERNHPGQDIQCRCLAIPVLDDLI